jgi:hypothetical protein
MRTLALLTLALCAAAASADFRYGFYRAERWGLMGENVGVGNCTIEDFEDANLAAGLQVRVITGNTTYGPTSTLPSVYVTSVDSFGSAFVNSQYTGVAGLINTGTNQTRFYNDANNWGDIELIFTTPVKVVGFSMYQREVATRLIINGVDVGELGSLTGLPQSGTRGGYVVITATGTDSISSLKLDNQGGDGFVIDDVAFSSVPSPEIEISGFPVWQTPDSAIGLERAAIETFESATLNPRLMVGWEARGGFTAASNTLPALFNPVTDDPFGNAFNSGVWDGVRGVVSGRNNRTYNYQDGTNWGDIFFQFNPPLNTLGMSVQQMEGNARLVINGRDVGSFSQRTSLNPGPGRQGYMKIITPGTAGIESIRFNNFRSGATGDGFMFDHMAMRGCGADFNDDGVVDLFDYLDFVSEFAANGPFADFNADTVVDFFDYLDFVAAFSSDC